MSTFTPINALKIKPRHDLPQEPCKRARKGSSATLSQESARVDVSTHEVRDEQSNRIYADPGRTSSVARKRKRGDRVTSYYGESKAIAPKPILEKYGSAANSKTLSIVEEAGLPFGFASSIGNSSKTPDIMPIHPQDESFSSSTGVSNKSPDTMPILPQDEDFFATDEADMEAFDLLSDLAPATAVFNTTSEIRSQDTSLIPPSGILTHHLEEEKEGLASEFLDHGQETSVAMAGSSKISPSQHKDEDFFANDEDDDIAQLEEMTHAIETSCRTSRRVHFTPEPSVKLHGPPTKCDTMPASRSGGILRPSTAEDKPIVRQPFPKPTKDRSGVSGLTASIRLCVCFRVGEALNVGCQAVRTNQQLILELYARVKASWRDDAKQFFTLSDLFRPGHPPFINAVLQLDQGVAQRGDAARFLDDEEDEKMCRVLGAMRRMQGAKWEMVIQDIQETSMADTRYVAGIYM